jgi:hypothetical protein
MNGGEKQEIIEKWTLCYDQFKKSFMESLEALEQKWRGHLAQRALCQHFELPF